MPANTQTPPSDVVAVQSHGRSYLFYVSPRNVISYLRSPPNGIESASAPPYEKKILGTDGQSFEVSPDCRQVAAISWDDQIRVYYADTDRNLKEVCKGGEGGWTTGDCGRDENWKLAVGSSISASVQRTASDLVLKVYAVRDGNANDNGMPQTSCFYIHLDKDFTGTWAPRNITKGIPSY
ncbi:hypothetical protein UCREL1_2371 [Eutypa lata UCREL1]|uniref:Uncharacterized protein n=1 Tax=Eutypa lata (strain UCR-EL1) TaxID=1287681 RepID=M7T184_EUTLA|nr:hypothetical protein UCREL1_2371 [Eutypa lata UCREL1]